MLTKHKYVLKIQRISDNDSNNMIFLCDRLLYWLFADASCPICWHLRLANKKPIALKNYVIGILTAGIWQHPFATIPLWCSSKSSHQKWLPHQGRVGEAVRGWTLTKSQQVKQEDCHRQTAPTTTRDDSRFLQVRTPSGLWYAVVNDYLTTLFKEVPSAQLSHFILLPNLPIILSLHVCIGDKVM